MSSPLRIVLADMAKVHSDGAYTVVHGGIDTWVARELPAEFAGALFIEIEPGALAPGEHAVSLHLAHAPAALVHLGSGRVLVGDPGMPVRFALPVTARVLEPQELKFEAKIGELVAAITVRVVVEPAPG